MPSEELDIIDIHAFYGIILIFFVSVHVKAQTDVSFVRTQLKSTLLSMSPLIVSFILEALTFNVEQLTFVCNLPETHNSFSICLLVTSWHEVLSMIFLSFYLINIFVFMIMFIFM